MEEKAVKDSLGEAAAMTVNYPCLWKNMVVHSELKYNNNQWCSVVYQVLDQRRLF